MPAYQPLHPIMTANATTDRDYGRRRLPVLWFLASVVAWLAIVKLVGMATNDRADVADGRLLTIGNLVWSLVVPLGVGCVFIYGLIAVLGWWRPLLYEPKPVRRWVWATSSPLRDRHEPHERRLLARWRPWRRSLRAGRPRSRRTASPHAYCSLPG